MAANPVRYPEVKENTFSVLKKFYMYMHILYYIRGVIFFELPGWYSTDFGTNICHLNSQFAILNSQKN